MWQQVQTSCRKMFLALDKAGFEMLPSVLNTPQIVVWKPLPSTGSQFAE